jgi:putative SOS response-associated peptidase YedK
MCGRYLLDTLPETLAEQFRSHKAPVYPARFNIAPTQPIVTVRADGESWAFSTARWGLVPAWAEDLSVGADMINARSETVREKLSFRGLFEQRRCLIPASGFYEWQRIVGTKRPVRIALASAPLFAFAGLYTFWRDPVRDAWIESATILTTAANDAMLPIHARMPVIVDQPDYATWLQGPADHAQGLLKAWASADMRFTPLPRPLLDERNLFRSGDAAS